MCVSRWTPGDDGILLQSTWRHGYARYDDMRMDPAIVFSCDSRNSRGVWPAPEVLTRRFKRLVETALKSNHLRQLNKKDSSSSSNRISQDVSNGGKSVIKARRKTEKTVSRPHPALYWQRFCLTVEQQQKFLAALQKYGVTKLMPDGQLEWSQIRKAMGLNR